MTDTIITSDDFKALAQIKGIDLVTEYRPFDYIQTASIALDYALGGHGFPRGLFTLIYGPEKVGKTTLAMLACQSAISSSMKVAILNLERRWNVQYAYDSGLGYPGKDYLLIEPVTLEAALNAITELAKAKFDLVVLDSLAAIAPKVEIAGSLEDAQIGLKPRVLSKWFQMITSTIASSNMAVVFLNQVRDKIGNAYETEGAPAGRAVRHHSSVIIKLRRAPGKDREYLAEPKNQSPQELIGTHITGIVTGNTVGISEREVSVHVRFYPSLHVAVPYELYDFGKAYGLFTTKEGKIYKGQGVAHFENVPMGKSRDAIAAWLADEDHIDTARSLDKSIREIMGQGTSIYSIEEDRIEDDEAI